MNQKKAKRLRRAARELTTDKQNPVNHYRKMKQAYTNGGIDAATVYAGQAELQVSKSHTLPKKKTEPDLPRTRGIMGC
jgi:hypothetical protein